MLEWKRGGLTQEILDNYCLLSGGAGETPVLSGDYGIGESTLHDWHDDEWYCVLPEITVYDPGMDWVDLPQDHVFRESDEYYDRSRDTWRPAVPIEVNMRVHETVSRKGRCRRKDLPPAKRKIVLTEWLVREGDGWYRTVMTNKPVGDEVIRIQDHGYEVDA